MHYFLIYKKISDITYFSPFIDDSALCEHDPTVVII